jgi:hypothetical protein
VLWGQAQERLDELEGQPPVSRRQRVVLDVEVGAEGAVQVHPHIDAALRPWASRLLSVFSAVKLAFNLLLGAQTAALAEAVRFPECSGLDRDQLLTAGEESGWRSPVLSYRAAFCAPGATSRRRSAPRSWPKTCTWRWRRRRPAGWRCR